MGVTPPHLRTSHNLLFSSRKVSWELEKDGCGSEIIVGSFENLICMCAHVKFWSRFCAIFVSNISVNIESTCINLISKCAYRQHNHTTITLN